MSGLLGRLGEEERGRLRVAREGDAGEPMLATAGGRREVGAGWVFERKLDGVRVLGTRRGERVRLVSRSGQPLHRTYPELVDALEAQRCGDFTVDGEVVALSGGRTDFARLQRRMQITDPARARASGVAVVYYVFDLLSLNGVDVTGLPLRVRKGLLRDAFRFRAPLRFTPHRLGDGAELLAAACARGWEGLIAKRADSAYVHRRSRDWLKLKCSAGQEFVVGGFTDPAGSRAGFGALLLGYYEGRRLRYAGKVGTGFPDALLRSLRRRLDGLVRERSPFCEEVAERGTHWVRPELVAQVGFTEWTPAGQLRHPRFLGLREDKPAAEVVRERPGTG
ncbi:non-homologous end-joining DNA ligase [Streptomyces gamaensis]|uniref:DNA ligase (ATP) n=1 Tax=Streptomyces gamaensis TaxID=1763542 RepID=A0ABW0ZAX9_9ACTN